MTKLNGARTSSVRRGAVLVATIAGLVAVAPQADGQVLDDVVVTQLELCSPDDLPEAHDQLQGDVPRADQESGRAKQGYNCGLSLVGHTPIWADPGVPAEQRRSRTVNANMAWAGDCAYVAGGMQLFGDAPEDEDADPSWGVAVIDASDPERPRHLDTLRTPGAVATGETLHAVETPERSLLVVGEYGNTGKADVPMDVYDVTNCTQPKRLTTFLWPENIHNLTITGDGRYVFATQPLQVVDLEPLFDGKAETGIRFLGNLEEQMPHPLVPVGPGADVDDALPAEMRGSPLGATASSLAHEAWPSHDGSTVYVGGVTPIHESITIVDLTEWLRRDEHGRPEGPPQIISQRSGRGHSIRTATVRQDGGADRRLLLHSTESVFGTAEGCFPQEFAPFAGPSEPWLTDITDEADPVRVSQFGLEINRRENCLSQIDSGVDASAHYHDVDNPQDTTFAMVSMWNAGLRVFDIREPEHPVEVAYFNPGDVGRDGVVLDKAWGHVRWVPETGHIWFATESGGFWVLELGPRVRQHLDFDAGDGPIWEPGDARPRWSGNPRSRRPAGHPGTAGAERTATVRDVTAPAAWCTLGAVAS